MPVDPTKPVIAETFIEIQVATFANLPAPATTRAGTLAWVEQTVGLNPAGLYQLHWVDNVTHVWEYVGGALSSALPDQRFTVGPFAYALQLPNVATHTSVNAGVTAASLGTGTALGAAGTSSRRLVEVQPYPYAETVVMRPWVGLRGMGTSPNDTVIDNAPGALVIGSTGAGEVFVAENLRIGGSIAITADHTITVIFRRCVFSETTLASILATVADEATLVLVFESCAGTIDTYAVSGEGTVQSVITGTLPENLGVAQSSGPLVLNTAITLGCDGGNFAVVDLEAHLQRTDGPFFLFDGAAGWFCAFGRCRLDNVSEEAVSPIVLSSGVVTSGSLIIAKPTLLNTPLQWCDAITPNNVTVTVEDYTILVTTPVLGAYPMRSTAPLVTATENPAIRGNRTSNVRRYTGDESFLVPAGLPYGPVYYITNPPNLVGGAVFDAYADEHWFAVDYGGGLPPDPNTGGPAFRFALFELPEPVLLEDGRVYVLKNITNPALVAPVAIALPNVAEPPLLSRIDWQNPRPVAFPILAAPDYIILLPGQFVRLTVDRFWNDGAVGPTHRGQYRITGRG